MLRKQVVIFFSFLIILVAGLSSVRGQEKKPELKDKRITIQMDNKPLFDVFMRLIYDYDVAIGFEESTLDSEHDDYQFEVNIPYDGAIKKWPDGTIRLVDFGGRPTIEEHLMTVDFKDARLEDVMNDIVKQMKNYDWEINNDVINIFPIRGRNPKFEKLLDLRIRKFAIEKGTEVEWIQRLIFNIPEFNAFLAENDLKVDGWRTFSMWFIDRPLPAEMEFSDLTFRELLNKITKSKRGGWILQRKKPNVKQTEGFIDIII